MERTLPSAWEAQTRELINQVEREIEDNKSEFTKRQARLESRKATLVDALVIYQEMRERPRQEAKGMSLSASDIVDKSQRDILRLVAQRNDGVLVVQEAIKLMSDAGIFGNPANADSAVYTVLSRYPNEFVRVGKGIYKVNGKGKHHTSNRHSRGSGLRDAIKTLREANPQLTKTEVLETLKNQDFDFQGKRPANAVNMAWVNLGYAGRKPKQTSMPLTT